MDATQLDRAELERLGVYEPDAPDAEDRLRLLAYLLDRGASSEDLVRAFGSGGLGALALELALRGGTSRSRSSGPASPPAWTPRRRRPCGGRSGSPSLTLRCR